MKEESRLRAIRDLKVQLGDMEVILGWAEHTAAEDFTPKQGVGIPQEKPAYRAWFIQSLEEQILNAKRGLLTLSKQKSGVEGMEHGEDSDEY